MKPSRPANSCSQPSQELDLLASLQEEHLFPVLEQNPETADLVRGARDDHQQTRALLNELAAIAKGQRCVPGQGGRAETGVSAAYP